ncbi:hypothetical protein MAPG_07647 [Magnaporthiopsis poae ATCC 64411]|uniref:AB hydrolase-1 domain-containing protein n=1 Tax=Magnaporthiopsis poae (strain ATCC 64411 / 73-15) TaxID=644358 RepID=A0A0C4E582_MAGP6|nr:hypothetical protein MAPG_07647 [Magnaporthiopsis poae ATCC 64411]
MAINKSENYPTIEQVLEHPAYPSSIWRLVPTRSGRLPVAEGRGGPLNISWEIHGSGPTKVVFIMGLGSFKTSWQRQTLHFGHEHGDKYSALLLDNRGMGDSDRPLFRYSTSEMALDVLEVLDHVGWTAARSVHVVGVSMGGMISQELACVAPSRVASLSLISTAAEVNGNDKGFVENLLNRAALLIPRGVEVSVRNGARRIFSHHWLAAPDDSPLPAKGTPGVEMPPDGGEYRRFGTNYERFVAQEMHKRSHKGFTTPGFLLQLIACGWHHKSREQLAKMADEVGRDRITVLHGTADEMISVAHGRVLVDAIQPKHAIFLEDLGHAIPMERTEWFNSMLKERIKEAEGLECGPAK